MSTQPRTTPKTIEDLADAVYPSFAMLAGMELDLFTPLKEGPLTAEDIARAAGTDRAKTAHLLHALVAIGLLKFDGNRFLNSPEADQFLVRGSPDYIGMRHHAYRRRADAIVKNMLLHSREGSGEHRPVDINALVEESLNLAYHGARAEKQGFTITLEQSLDPAAGAADVFPQDITRALLNLISNGFYAATKRKAETNGGDYEPTLAAATKNLGDRVEIRIRDNGTGIPPDVKERIFNPFFTTKPAGEGTGLGLSISHDIIVKQHGGSIEVDTKPGEFTEIRIILPRAAMLPTERA